MTILNIHIDDKDKEKVKELAEKQKEKSMSEYVRKVLTEKIKIQEAELNRNSIEDVKIPDYVPKNKYVGFIKGAIIAVSDSPSEIAQVAIEKFPNLPLVVKFNGPKKKQMEYCYLNLSELSCWKYAQIEDFSYPIIPVLFKADSIERMLSASIDTASSLCVLKNDLFPKNNFEISREEKISTATGIIKSKIYKCSIGIGDKQFKTEFVLAPIPENIPFRILIGRNLLDQLDTYLFGKKQIICLKSAE